MPIITPTMFFRFLCTVTMLGVCAAGRAENSAPIKRFPTPNEPGMARAVRVDDVPLAHTTIMLGYDATGKITGDARTQALHAIQNAAAALESVGATIKDAVKLHGYVANETHVAALDAAIAQVFSDRPVAVSFVTSALTDPAAFVGLDVIAPATARSSGVRLQSTDKVPAPLAGPHVSILPAGRRIFFSGQAQPDKDLRAATRKSMESLWRGLEWMKGSKADIVQVKAFLQPFSACRDAADEIKRFFDGGAVPPVLLVEWANGNSPIEIEWLVAGRGEARNIPEGIAFLTPPGMTASTRFARVAEVAAGHPLIFISGLYGETTGTGRREWLEIFGQLSDILWETGSSFRHQVKGFYYSSTAQSRRLHGEIREVFFDPARPPASSGMITRGTGRPGRESTIDMIAIPIPRGK